MVNNILVAKIVLAFFFTFLGAAGAVWFNDGDKFWRFAAKVLSLFVSIRTVLFLCIFVILGVQPQSDSLVYYDWARLTITGQIPGESESLPLHYGPLFLYVIGLLTYLWNDPRVVIVLAICVELILFAMWLSLKGTICGEAVMRRASVLYAFCPLSVSTTAIGGNNDVLAGMFVAMFTVLALRSKSALSGAVAGLSVIASKALTILAALPVFISSERKLLWLLGASTPAILVYGISSLFSIDPVAGFRFHGTHYSSGNLPFWIGLFGVDMIALPQRWAVNAISALLVLFMPLLPLIVNRSVGRSDLVPSIAATILMFMLVSAKSFPHYLLIALFPIMIVIAEIEKKETGIILYCVFSIVTTVESSLWFRLFNNEAPVAIHNMMKSNWIAVYLFGLVETILLMTYAGIVWHSISRYVRIWSRNYK